MRGALSAFVLIVFITGMDTAAMRQRTITLWDYTGDTLWAESIQTVIQDFNAVLPHGVRLRYAEGSGKCHSQRGAVSVCVDSRTNNPTVDIIWNRAVTRPLGATINMVHVERLSRAEDRRHWLCHELMHALTGVADNYNAMPDDSCVWGNTMTPGPFDVELLQKIKTRR